MATPKTQATAAVAELERAIGDAASRGIDLPYARATLYCCRIALGHRWDLYKEDRKHLGEWVEDGCRRQSKRIDDILAGRRQPLVVPPVVDMDRLATLKKEGWYWVGADGRPELLLSVHTRPPEELQDFFVPWVWSTWVSGVGASRFDFRSSPIWEAYQKYPETHRVFGGGWCGHIIKDRWSMGGDEGECIICLESPKTREAVVGYIEKHLPQAMKRKGRLISLLDYEYVYTCYCDYTKEMFREFVKSRHGDVATLNRIWGTEYASFGEVQLPPMTGPDFLERPGGPVNPAQLYDWGEFNLHRFTDYMKWAKSVQRSIDPHTAMATCAPHYNFVASFAESGSDVELMAHEVNDVLLNESGPSTKYVDFLRSVTPEAKPVMDVESSSLTNTLANYLHGEAAIAIYWGWSREPTGRAGDRIPFGYRGRAAPIEDTERILRTALDIRRLAPQITELATAVAFDPSTVLGTGKVNCSGHPEPRRRVEAPVAILYSRASLLQVPHRAGRHTAYLMELESVYNAMLETGRAADFVTTRRVLEGALADYALLIVPAATYENEDVYRQVMEFVADGGAVLLIPNSFFFDEYAKPRPDYLGSVGIEVNKMQAPVLKAGAARTGIERDAAGEETEAPFIQGLIIDTVRRGVPKSNVQPTERSFLSGLPTLRRGSGWPEQLTLSKATLKGAGVRHRLGRLPSDAVVLATFADGGPALIEVPREKGRIYYLCQPLQPQSYAVLFTRLLAELGCDLPLVVTSPAGNHVDGVEYRSLRRADGTVLAYVNNLRRQNRRLKLTWNPPARSVWNLSLEEEASENLSLPALECFLLEAVTQ